MIFCAPLGAAVEDLTVDVPKTSYIEWIANPSDPVTQVNGDLNVSFDPFVGGPITQLVTPVMKTTYLAIMCNALTGYQITLTGTGTTTTTSGEMALAGAASLDYTTNFTTVAGTFAAGATVSINVDMTGATPSASVTFASESDLPMAAASPNVFSFSNTLPTISTVADGLIMAGTYSGGYTVVVSLP